MRVIGVIPSRWGSTRLPGKSLLPLCGKPLVQHVVERGRMCRELDDLLVATDDQRIVDVVESFGGRAVMTRPDHPSGTDRIAEAISGLDADLVVNIQGDEPLLDPALVDSLVVQMRQGAWDMGTAATPLEDVAALGDPAVVKVVFGANKQALYFSRSVIPCNRDGDVRLYVESEPVYWRHIGLYAYRRDFLMRLVAVAPCVIEQTEKLEQLRALHMGCRMLVVPTHKVSVGVDTPADVVTVERLLGEQSDNA
ncbi:MAG: 3-deoxy-manno-octulosonate cytidylyltransferase [Kiritimatiellia bacterium]